MVTVTTTKEKNKKKKRINEIKKTKQIKPTNHALLSSLSPYISL
jgi:hypothetical protein